MKSFQVKMRHGISVVLVLAAVFLAMSAAASVPANPAAGENVEDKALETKAKDSAPSSTASHPVQNEKAMRLEGEKRFRANCARCHASPPTFPPRMMATILRHMRVRANITDEDRKLILRYMTQ